MSTLHAVIYEPGTGGHRMTYVRQLLLGLNDLARVTFVCDNHAPKAEEFKVQVARRFPDLDVSPTLSDGDRQGHALMKHRYAQLREASATLKPDILYVPTSDGLTQSAGLARTLGKGLRGTSEAAMHRGTWAYPKQGLKAKLAARLSLELTARSPWSRLLFVDPIGYEHIRDHRPDLAKRCEVLPDPVDPIEPIDRAAARDHLNLPRDARLLVMLGLIDTRKGAHHAIPAFSKAVRNGDVAPTDTLVLAGRVRDNIRPHIDQKLVDQGRIILLDRYLTDEEFAFGLAAADVALTPHWGHVGLSNVVLRAAAAGRMVLGSDWGWQRRIVEHFGLGRVTNIEDHQAFGQAMAESLEASTTYQQPDRAKRLLEFHRRESFTAAWLAPLRERLGLEADPNLRTWEWLTRSPAPDA